MAGINGREFEEELQGIFEQKEGLRLFLQDVLNCVMRAEQEAHLGAKPYERVKD